MSTPFSLLNSLLPISEDVNPPAEKPTEYAEIDDVDRTGGFRGTPDFDAKYNVHVSYYHPALEDGIHLTVNAMLEGRYDVEDDSFDYEYGSQRGVHSDVYDVISDLRWTTISIPHIRDNMDFFKLDQAKANHVKEFLVNFITNMKQEEIEKWVDPEFIAKMVKPDYSD